MQRAASVGRPSCCWLRRTSLRKGAPIPSEVLGLRFESEQRHPRGAVYGHFSNYRYYRNRNRHLEDVRAPRPGPVADTGRRTAATTRRFRRFFRFRINDVWSGSARRQAVQRLVI